MRHLIVATANLAEAEARALKKGAVRTGIVFAVLLAALLMALTSLGLGLAALFNALWAQARWPASWAYVACAAVCVTIAIGLAWLTARLAK